MSDRELLELAAKAAGYEVINQNDEEMTAEQAAAWAEAYDGIDVRLERPGYLAVDIIGWNPLDDDGDAFRLMVKLKVDFFFGYGHISICHGSMPNIVWGDYGDDPAAATRRAIVRAAAEIGRGMK